jgi:hypothetical protein
MHTFPGLRFLTLKEKRRPGIDTGWKLGYPVLLNLNLTSRIGHLKLCLTLEWFGSRSDALPPKGNIETQFLDYPEQCKMDKPQWKKFPHTLPGPFSPIKTLQSISGSRL